MKNISKVLLFTLAVVGFTACDKVDDLKVNQNATASVLSVSSSTIASLPADSNKTALTLNWTYPNHAVSDPNTIKYTIEIDSAGKNFSNPFTQVVTGNLTTSFTGKDLNTFLVNRGYAFSVPVSMEIRLTSSYANNNERVTSNVIPVKMTPYKVPPKVALPTTGRLFLVGSATTGGWNNPVPTPSQEFARLDETTFAGVFNLSAAGEFLVLPLNGNWDHKFSIADNSLAGAAQGGNFGFDLAQNFKGPATAGLYKIVLDFQAGKYTVTPYVGSLPDNLFIVGDATSGGWGNPVPTPGQQFTRKNSSQFELTLPLVGGKEYLLLPSNGSWDHKFAVADNSVTGISAGGQFGYDAPQNFKGPATDGTYKIEVNFVTNTFKVTKQ